MALHISSVLVANRGEIACRVMRTLRAMGIESVAVHSDADVGAAHVRAADRAVRIGPAAAAHSYLAIDRVIGAALATGAQAVHPGYGFLAENAAFAAACEEAGLIFIGPPASAIAAMGDKLAAKRMVAAAGVPVVPGTIEPLESDAELVQAALEVGLPVLLKPSAGGGGKGMHLVERAEDLAGAVAAARREARGAFGDDTLLVERFVANPRHIEIQVLADTHGNVVHLGERECSLQRRHQKVVEEAPSPLLHPDLREAMGAQAVAVARACGYVSAGTVELIVPAEHPEQFSFMEMNTRLQVEHAVTELVYGVDLVELQLRIAAGEALPFAQRDLTPRGHAVEARVYAEDPARGFLPSAGTVLALHEAAGDRIRVDSALAVGAVVGTDYDPMLAKVIAHGSSRDEALTRLDRALADTTILGLTTNVGFLRSLLADEDVRAGVMDTGLIERRLTDLLDPPAPAEPALVAALIGAAPSPDGTPWGRADGWRLGGRAWVRSRWELGDATVAVAWRAQPAAGGHLEVQVDDGPITTVAVEHEPGALVVVGADGARRRFQVVAHGDVVWVGSGGSSWMLRIEQRDGSTHGGRVGSHGPVRSPMPGKVVAVLVAEGDSVVAGQPVATVEAMKMEHTLLAPIDGVVVAVHAPAGSQVALDEAVLELAPHGGVGSTEVDPGRGRHGGPGSTEVDPGRGRHNDNEKDAERA